MAVSLRQVGRTVRSVTFSVSGIEHDRSTEVWITSRNHWLPIADAASDGYISRYEALLGDNGTITVWPNDTDELKVWQFRVYDINSEDGSYWYNTISTVLMFEYENASTKRTGDDVDITVYDLQQINLFGSYINSWIAGGEGFYYYLDKSAPGTDIYAEFLTAPAQNIYDTAAALSSSELPNRSSIMSRTRNIINNVYSGADFKAEYFNDIKEAINDFNMSV